MADGSWAAALPTTPPGIPEDSKTLWVGELAYWMDEAYLASCFNASGETVNVKVIRNKQTGQSDGYGFVEFQTHAMAEYVLHNWSGAQMLNAEQTYKMNWASFGINEKPAVKRYRDVRPEADPSGPEFSIFVGDLAHEVGDFQLFDTFRARYSSAKSAKIVVDPQTGRSKGYGFVRFSDEAEKDRAMTEMNGEACMGRPMRISSAAPRKSRDAQGPSIPREWAGPAAEDPTNSTVFVGALDPSVSEEQLRAVFAPFGELVYVKIPVGKNCGFVQFVSRASAAEAVDKLHGYKVGGSNIRVTWGRSSGPKRAASAGYDQGYHSYEQQAYDEHYWGASQPPARQESQRPQTAPREEAEDPIAPPNIDKLNAAYMALHQGPLSGRALWLRAADTSVSV